MDSPDAFMPPLLLQHGRKRSFEKLMNSNYSKYGTTTGVLTIDTSITSSCGLLCAGWPSWAFALTIRGWRVELIILKESPWLEALKVWFPDTRVITYVSGDKLLGEYAKIRNWFCDVEPPRSLCLWNSDAELIVTCRRARHVQDSSWRMIHLCLAHVDAGGATDGSWSLNVYHKENLSFDDISCPTSYRDLSSILDAKVGGMPCPPPQSIPYQGKPGVLEVRPNTFHGGGLLPWKSRSPFVVAPCVYSPTGWVRRRINSQEFSIVLDVPELIRCSLTPALMSVLLKDTDFVPERVLLKFLDCLDTNATTVTATGLFVETDNRALSDGVEASICLDKVADSEVRNLKAAKNDDAPVPEYLWDDRIVPDGDAKKIEALQHIRTFALRWWWRHTTKEFLRWFKNKYPNRQVTLEFYKDIRAGRECIHRCCNSTWWDWTGGSRPLFWRWPNEYFTIIRDGLPPWIKGSLPKYRVPQRAERDVNLRSLVKSKLQKVRDKGYIVPGNVVSLTSFFTVPKGDGDVRLVYDATKSGLNTQLWAPWFLLPTIESHLRCVHPGSYMGDIDLSEQFLNFILHEKVQPFAGVDLTSFFAEELTPLKTIIWEHWTRCGMGFVSSPYTAVQATLFAEEVIRGDPTAPNNIFRWNDVQLNLPGDVNYKPCDPWVYKVRFNTTSPFTTVANDLKIYVDDVRTIGCSYEECRQASRVVASLFGHLGVQDAPRKRRDPTQSPGPWAGSIIHTTKDAVLVTISLERWLKAKAMIDWIEQSCNASDLIEFKTLESYRGFLIYVCRTFPAINPYLKGIHLTLDSWRPWRSEDAWKLSMAEIRAALKNQEDSLDCPDVSSSKPPKLVKIAPRLLDDVRALKVLFEADEPPNRQVRPDNTTVGRYMFGDASGSGFGSSLEINSELHYVHGQWNDSMSAESSNYRELSNLINAVEAAASKGLLDKSEIFVFTDNFAAESTFHKGTSSSKRLFELMLSLRKLQMNKGLPMHVVHVSGKRMISQGTDGLSRGEKTKGVMTGTSMIHFVPLNIDAITRQEPSLKEWATSWFSGKDPPLFLNPNDWFVQGQTHSTCVWAPPPAAADAALEQLAYSIHKRPNHTHLVLIPRLMTSRWRKLLGKICCLVFTVPIGTDIWSFSQFEPLIVGLYLPLSRHYPWNLRGTALLERVERVLRDLPPSSPRWGGIVLRELLFQARAVESMSAALPTNEDGLVYEEDGDSTRYRQARNGDNLMTPFQCDTCHFRNMMNRNPEPSLAQDHRVLKCIRRANLDSLWSVEPRTVSRNLTECRRGSNIAASLGFERKLFRPMGPFPLDDTFGMCAAVVILQVSLNPGKHDKNVQFGTIRKFRSAFANAYHASAEAQDAMVMAKDIRKLSVTKCPTYGAWFEKFMRGCHKRMGEIVKPDRALSAVVLLEILKILEAEWDLYPDQKFRLASEGAFYVIAFSCALRGEEVPLADLAGMQKHWDKGIFHDPAHITVALLGRFKGEVGENYHLLPIVPITRSGINNKLWISRLLDSYKSYGITSGPVFRNSRGLRIKAGDMEPVFFDRLEQVQAARPDIIPATDDVVEEYGIYRSFRRGSTSEATNQGLPPEVIDANNRWRKFLRAGASRPTLHMRDHYADVRLTLNQSLRYSSCI